MDHAIGQDASRAPANRAASNPGWIILARHGMPKTDRNVKIDWRGYLDWWAQYERDGLAPGQTPPPALVAVGAAADCVFASTRPRAIETAKAVTRDKEIVIDPIFVEASLPPPPIAGKRSPREWGVWARIAWWMGRSAGQESRSAAELRAQAAVATLAARALRGENVILFAHGWFNRMMRPVLREAGWTCVHDGKDGYWSFRKYTKRG